MEWQANNLAPRILMPIQTFKIKVDELYKQYDYENTPLKLAVLTCIADDLASFYGVSRQSALIRMTETGYMEAKSVLQAINEKDWHSYVSREDVFYEYSTNEDFRKLLDSGKFRYVDGYVVINDEKYITTDDKGKATLSEYAWDNLDAVSYTHLSLSPGRYPLSVSVFASVSDTSLFVTKIQRLFPSSIAFSRLTACNVVPDPAKKSSINADGLSARCV